MKKLFAIIAAAMLCAAQPTFAATGATLTIVPASISVHAGEAFSVDVQLASPEIAANAIAGSLSFDAQKMSVDSISKDGSVLGLWLTEPTFSNTAGTISWSGLKLQGGFTGTHGQILKLHVRARASGTANITWTNAVALAGDGNGTPIPVTTHGATITIGETAVVSPGAPNVSGTIPTTAAEQSLPVLGAPVIIDYPHDLRYGEGFVVVGTAATNTSITIHLTPADGAATSFTTQSDAAGHFALRVTDRLSRGSYDFFLEEQRGTQVGPPSVHGQFTVHALTLSDVLHPNLNDPATSIAFAAGVYVVVSGIAELLWFLRRPKLPLV